MIYVPYTAATRGMLTSSTFCQAMRGFLCEGPVVIPPVPAVDTTSAGLPRGYLHRHKQIPPINDAQDLRDLMDIIQILKLMHKI